MALTHNDIAKARQFEALLEALPYKERHHFLHWSRQAAAQFIFANKATLKNHLNQNHRGLATNPALQLCAEMVAMAALVEAAEEIIKQASTAEIAQKLIHLDTAGFVAALGNPPGRT